MPKWLKSHLFFIGLHKPYLDALRVNQELCRSLEKKSKYKHVKCHLIDLNLVILFDKFIVIYICLRSDSSRSIPLTSTILRAHLIESARKHVESEKDNTESKRKKLENYYMKFLLKCINLIYRKCNDLNSLKTFVQALFKSEKSCQEELMNGPDDVCVSMNASGENAFAPMIVFVFDEARQLFDSENDPILFKALRDSFHNLRNKNIFGLFMDTSSKISNFAPSFEYDPSTRISGRDLLNPFVLKGFWDLPIAEKLPLFERHLLYGRPLWAALHLNSKNEGDMTELVKLAQTKLINQTISNNSVWNEFASDHTTAIAILSFRFCLTLNPSATLGNELIANHMRSLVEISPDRSGIFSMCPSEPILSFAARNICLAKGNLWNMIPILQSLLQNSHATAGDRGELAVTVILMDAYDDCL